VKYEGSKNNLDHLMVIPFGALEVAHLVHHGLEPVVHGLRLFPFVEDESTEFSLDRLALGDLGHCWGLVLKCFELRTRQHKEC
jgi:hypothetical protein